MPHKISLQTIVAANDGLIYSAEGIGVSQVLIDKPRAGRRYKLEVYNWVGRVYNKSHRYNQRVPKHAACLLVQSVRLRATLASYVSYQTYRVN